MKGRGSKRLSANSFVGREAELGRIRDLILDGAQVITVVGVGGAGKTRLAREVIARYGDDFSGGARFVDLAETRDAVGFAAAVAREIAAPLHDLNGAAATLGECIAAKGAILVVLDNFEQLVDVGAAMVARWLSLAPEAVFLVTSRERLRIRGEVSFSLEPFATPRAGSTRGREIRASDAVELFVRRTLMVRPSYRLTKAEAPLVAEIVRRLDGIPLAIELCAARMDVLGSPQLLSLLLGQPPLSASSRASGESPLNMRATLDWSFQLLSPEDQRAFAELSVFRGSIPPHAVDFVLTDAARSGRDAMTIVRGLFDKSLLTAEESPDGSRRMRMYETVREYAAQKLEELGDTRVIEARHAAFFSALFDDIETLDVGEIEADRDNLIAVRDRALAERSLVSREHAVRCLLVMQRILGVSAGGAILTELLEGVMEEGGLSDFYLAHAHVARGTASYAGGKPVVASSDFERAIALATKIGDDAILAAAQSRLGLCMLAQGDETGAERLMAQARATEERTPLAASVRARLAHERASRVWSVSSHEAADEHYAASIALYRSLGWFLEERIVTIEHAATMTCRGEFERASALHARARTLGRTREDARIEAQIEVQRGIAENEQGNVHAARALLGRALSRYLSMGDRRWENLCLLTLGHIELEAGDALKARGHYVEASLIADEVGLLRHRAIAALGEAVASAQLGRPEARRLFEQATRLVTTYARPRDVLMLDILLGVDDLVRAGSLAEPEASEARAAARARLSRSADAVRASDDVRWARRILTAWLAADDDRDAGPPAGATRRDNSVSASEPHVRRPDTSTLDEATLAVSTSGRRFRPPSGDWVVVPPRSALSRLVLAMATRHLETRGEAMDVKALFEAGWPGERARDESVKSRVYMALSRLRRLGLREVIVHTEDGYRIAPMVRAVILDEERARSLQDGTQAQKVSRR